MTPKKYYKKGQRAWEEGGGGGEGGGEGEEEEQQQQKKKQKATTKQKTQLKNKMAINKHLTIITLDVNGLNAPIKKHRVDGWIRKQDI